MTIALADPYSLELLAISTVNSIGDVEDALPMLLRQTVVGVANRVPQMIICSMPASASLH